MKLIRPTETYKDQYVKMIHAFEAEGVSGFWSMRQTRAGDFNFEEFLEIDKQYEDPESEYSKKAVPSNTYWLIDDNKLIGHTNIRHRINEDLLKKNGNIGYHIAPWQRRKGYGSMILSLALEKAKELVSEDRVLLTCDAENIGSARVIEKNGGVLENTIDVDGEMIKRYWIAL